MYDNQPLQSYEKNISIDMARLKESLNQIMTDYNMNLGIAMKSFDDHKRREQEVSQKMNNVTSK